MVPPGAAVEEVIEEYDFVDESLTNEDASK